MSQIKTSGFDLTPSIKRAAIGHADDLADLIPEEAQIKVHMKKIAKNYYIVKMVTHVWKHDLVAQEKHKNLYTGMSHTKNKLYREIEKLKGKQFDRHKGGAVRDEVAAE